MKRALFATPILLLGCTGVSNETGNAGLGEQTGCIQPDYGYNTGPLPEGCGKIEGGDIGHATEIVAGAITIQITGWITKDDHPGEYIGFTYTAPAGTVFTIKASTEVFVEDGDGTWIHPAGTFGPDASAISNIVVCEGERTPEQMEPTPPPPDENNPTAPCTPPAETCTVDEDCASGICQDGVCVSI